MSLAVSSDRKSVVVTYDQDLVKGDTIFVAGVEDGEFIRKEEVPNRGFFLVSYPASFTGASTLRVRGSDSGEDEGVLQIV